MKYFIILFLQLVFLQAENNLEIISISALPDTVDIKQPFEISVVVFDTSLNFLDQNHKIAIYFESGLFISRNLYFTPDLSSNYFRAEHLIDFSSTSYQPTGLHPIALFLKNNSDHFFSTDLQALGLTYQIQIESDDYPDETAPILTGININPSIIDMTYEDNVDIEFTLDILDKGYGLSQNSTICYQDYNGDKICSLSNWNFTLVDTSGNYLAKKDINIDLERVDSSGQYLIDLKLLDLFGQVANYRSEELDSLNFIYKLDVIINRGCTDPSACNFNSSVAIDDGSCEYSQTYYDCDGNCILDEGCSLIDYCLQLNIGANLVSFHSLPDNVSVSNVLDTLETSVQAIFNASYSAMQLSSNQWFGSLTSIRRDEGYWIIIQDSLNTDLCFVDTKPSIDSLSYSLNYGFNLISFPIQGSVPISDALPDSIENHINTIISDRSASTQLFGDWYGSISSFSGGKGYWIDSNLDMVFEFELNNVSRSNNIIHKPLINNLEYNQSTKQAFYFIDTIENIKEGDYVLSFNGDKLIGVRQWQGSMIDVPVMGYDGNSYSGGYIELGTIPSFKLLSDGELTLLDGNIPAWSDNGIFMVSNLSQVIVPDEYSLSQAYPNPFNPKTTLSFAIPVDNEVTLSIYNLQGREVATLIEGNMSAGYHSVVWDANPYSSGIYFVKMMSSNYTSIQKLMLIK